MPVAAQGVRTLIVNSEGETDQDWIWKLTAFRQINLVGHARTLAEATQLIRHYHVELVMVNQPAATAQASIEHLRAIAPETVYIAIVTSARAEELRQLLASGARVVLPANVSSSKLLGSLRDLIRTRSDQLYAQQTQPAVARSRVVVTIAPKGGVGTTSIATNLAIALRQLTGRLTALADFNLQFGNVDAHLNLPPYNGEATPGSQAQDRFGMRLRLPLEKHASGIHVLSAPEQPNLSVELEPDQISKTLEQLREQYAYVVADTWSFLDDVSGRLLVEADTILLITTPELPMLKNARRFLSSISRRGVAMDKLHLVLNRFPSVNGIALADVEHHLGASVQTTIPSDGQLMMHAVNTGVPVLLSHPDSPISQGLLKLASQLIDRGDRQEPPYAEPEGAERKPGVVRGLRERLGH